MTQIIATPKDMHAFARSLMELARSIRQRQAQLESEMNELKHTWNDQRYAEFSRVVKQASEQLMVFNANAQLFADYLDRKAAAGERYLRGG
jgi:uncharacterized protein YukE